MHLPRSLLILGFGAPASALVAIALSFSSTPIIIKLLEASGKIRRPEVPFITSILTIEDLLAVFFLGGGSAPLPFLGFIPSWIWMLSKAMLMMFVFLWFRWTFPRLRVDQLMDFNWKFLLPWSFANIGFAGVLVYLHLRGWGLG